MRKTKNKNITIFIYLLLFAIVSITTLYSTLDYLNTGNLVLKQMLIFTIGILIILFMLKIGNEKILKYSLAIYLSNIFLLVFVLFFGKEINGTKAWINIPFFQSLQPSEFMKIGLILFLAKTITNSIKKKNKEIFIIIKSFIIFLVPAILTFLEPDTGAVFVYLIITLIMLFGAGIKLKWFGLGLGFLLLFTGVIALLYFFQHNLFINVFGTNFFYRFDRIIDWVKSSGMQLENSVIGISSSGLLGNGFSNIPIYFPELQTDFIFASFVCCFGLLGTLFLLIILLSFDLKIFEIIKNTNNSTNKLILFGIVSTLIYQQIQNIAMTIGLLPITGITLPFISYGGSSLLSYIILIGIVANINNEKKK